MMISWTKQAWEEYLNWQECDKKILERINTLIKDIERNSYEGIGEPEPLKYHWSGYWSRRINREHRLIYKSTDTQLIIVQCRYHY